MKLEIFLSEKSVMTFRKLKIPFNRFSTIFYNKVIRNNMQKYCQLSMKTLEFQPPACMQFIFRIYICRGTHFTTTLKYSCPACIIKILQFTDQQLLWLRSLVPRKRSLLLTHVVLIHHILYLGIAHCNNNKDLSVMRHREHGCLDVQVNI